MSGVTFGEYTAQDAVVDAKGNFIRTAGRFAGFVARMFASGKAESESSEAESPCPDAVPGDTGPTPCEKEAARLRAKAEQMRARRLQRRGGV